MYSLVGIEGNAFSLMGYTEKALKECGFSQIDIDEMREKAMSGDYNNLICVCNTYIRLCNKKVEATK